MMNGWYGDGWGGGVGWLFMGTMFLVFWGAVVSLVIYLLRRGQIRNDGVRIQRVHHDAERILAERFARGEIDAEEFTKRITALRSTE